jgi:hypothetical protein
LLISAKNLLVEAMAPTGHGTKTFEPDQSFEPGARNRARLPNGSDEQIFGANQQVLGRGQSDKEPYCAA